MKNLDGVFGEGFTDNVEKKISKELEKKVMNDIGDLNSASVDILREAYKAAINPVGYTDYCGYGDMIYEGVIGKNKEERKAIILLKDKGYIELLEGRDNYYNFQDKAVNGEDGYITTRKGMEIFDKYFRKEGEPMSTIEKIEASIKKIEKSEG